MEILTTHVSRNSANNRLNDDIVTEGKKIEEKRDNCFLLVFICLIIHGHFVSFICLFVSNTRGWEKLQLCNIILQKQNMLGWYQTDDLESCFPAVFDLMMALRSTETHNTTLKNLTLLRPKLCDSLGTNQFARFVNYDGYRKNMVEFSIRLHK